MICTACSKSLVSCIHLSELAFVERQMNYEMALEL